MPHEISTQWNIVGAQGTIRAEGLVGLIVGGYLPLILIIFKVLGLYYLCFPLLNLIKKYLNYHYLLQLKYC